MFIDQIRSDSVKIFFFLSCFQFPVAVAVAVVEKVRVSGRKVPQVLLLHLACEGTMEVMVAVALLKNGLWTSGLWTVRTLDSALE